MNEHQHESRWKKFKRAVWAPLDPCLFFAMSAVYVMSLFLLYSADGQSFGQLENKIVHTVIGFALLWLVAQVPPQAIAKWAFPAYLAGVAMLAAVEAVGVTVNGSTRWLDVGVRIQPSEIMKIALPMTLAWFFQRYADRLRWQHYVAALFLVAVPGVLVLKQPDLGTAVLMMASGIFVIFFAGLPWKAIFAAAAAFVAALPLIWHYGLHDYQKARVLTLFDPSKDPLGDGYHIIQSMIAIGSGGVWGKGWLNGTQTHLNYIPESTTDFIFAVFGEEFGLIGNILLLSAYLVILARGLYIAGRAKNLYSRTLAGALTMTFFCYAFVNMGMVSGILPVVGVPLPLVSYGGTATISIMLVLALLTGIANEQKFRRPRQYPENITHTHHTEE